MISRLPLVEWRRAVVVGPQAPGAGEEKQTGGHKDTQSLCL